MKISLVAAFTLALACLPLAAQDDSGFPPLPSSPHELVTSGAQLLNTPIQRAHAMGLLELAIQDYTFSAPAHPPTVLVSSFQSDGSSMHEGSGNMEHIWIGNHGYWFSDFAGVENNKEATSLSSTPIPLRVLMANLIQIAPVDRTPSLKEIRAAAANLDGTPVTCVLVTEARVPSTAPGRSWLEAEYCMDSSGLLRYASPAPGVYWLFDYTAPLQYAGHTLASNIRMIEDSSAQMSMHTNRFGAPNSDDQQRFQAATGRLGGTGHFYAQFRTVPQQTTIDSVVVVVAVIDSQGTVVEAELPGAATSNSQTAMQRMQNMRFPPTPGAQNIVYAYFKF